MKKVMVILVAAIFSLLMTATFSYASNHKFPDCHGKNSVPCRPDPQPSHGKDCLKHGKGGVNEDHCAKPSVNPTPTPTPTLQPKPKPSTCITAGNCPEFGAGGPLAKTAGLDSAGISLLGAWGAFFLLIGALIVRGSKHSRHTG